MDWLDILSKIFTVAIIPMLGTATALFVTFIRAKQKQIAINSDNELVKKYSDMLSDTIVACVITTNQTYVDSLKASGSFTKECQKKALQMTTEAVLNILSDEAMNYLNNIYGDLNLYITEQIEATVKLNKD